jgi:nicotianamine synthase
MTILLHNQRAEEATPALTSMALGDRLHRVYHRLALLPSLDPSDDVDALFRELVRLVQTTPPSEATSLLDDPVLAAVRERLQALCAEGEARLETHWARRIVETPSSAGWRELEAFPYFENYERLARLELAALDVASPALDGARRRRGVFIGSGPLPLTSILLAARHGLAIVNLDLNPDAAILGRRVAAHLGIESSLEFVASDVLSYPNIGHFDVVFVAALVGRHRVEKRTILQHIRRHAQPHASVVVRSAHRLRTLLYPGVELEDLGGLIPLLELHPHDDVINSVIIARPPDPSARACVA